MQGICVDVGSTTTLNVDEKYYLFEHGKSNYYVSRFNSVNAHFGSYKREHFKVIEDVVVEGKELFIDGFMVAEIVATYKGYALNVGERFVVGSTRQNNGTHFYYYHLDDMRFRGCMPVGIFKIIEPFDDIALKRTETAKLEVLGETDTNTPTDGKTSKNKADLGAETAQMNIFDFI